MITESILSLFFGFTAFLFSFLPDVDITVDSSGFGTIFNILRMVCYFLPMGTVTQILLIILAITAFKIAVAVIKTIWQLLPFT